VIRELEERVDRTDGERDRVIGQPASGPSLFTYGWARARMEA
jgi:hypothetical protein